MLMQLAWLSVAMFAIGSEIFMIAGLLPVVAADLSVSVSSAGQLLTLSSLVYALTSPVTATLTAGFDRKRVLLASLAGFLLACVLAASATSYAALAGARVLLAVSAGLFSPAALAFAGVMAAPEQRGRALAFVVGGVSASVALGAPLGTLIGNLGGWRVTYLAVAAIAGVAFLGIALRLPALGAGQATPLRERLRTAGQRDVALALLVTLFWSMGGFTVYTYTAPLVQAASGWTGALVSVVLLAFGIGAVGGTALGGTLADRMAPARIQTAVLAGLATLSIAVSLTVLVVEASWVGAVLIAVIYALWGVVGWTFHPAQQVRLMGMAPRTVPVVLSLNQSAMYLGMSAGGLMGGLTLRFGSLAALGWVAAAAQITALALLALALRSRGVAESAKDNVAAPIPAQDAPAA